KSSPRATPPNAPASFALSVIKPLTNSQAAHLLLRGNVLSSLTHRVRHAKYHGRVSRSDAKCGRARRAPNQFLHASDRAAAIHDPQCRPRTHLSFPGPLSLPNPRLRSLACFPLLRPADRAPPRATTIPSHGQ